MANRRAIPRDEDEIEDMQDAIAALRVAVHAVRFSAQRVQEATEEMDLALVRLSEKLGPAPARRRRKVA